MWGTIIFLQLLLLSAKQMHIYWFSKVLAVKTNSKALRPGEMHDRIPPQSFHTATMMTACPSVPTVGHPHPQLGVICVLVQRKINLLLLVQQLHQFLSRNVQTPRFKPSSKQYLLSSKNYIMFIKFQPIPSKFQTVSLIMKTTN